MGLIALICPQCNGEVKLDKDREFGFCQYCGTKIMVETAQHISGTVNVSRQPEVENLLGRALQYERDGDLEQAEAYFNRVLDIDMNDQRALEGYERVRTTITEPNVFIYNGQAKRNMLLTIKEGSENVCALWCGTEGEAVLPAGRHTLAVYWGKKQLDNIKLRIGTRYERVYITCNGGQIDIKHTGRAKRQERTRQEPEGQAHQKTQGYEPRKKERKGHKKKKSCLRVALGVPLAIIGFVIFMSALFGEESGDNESPLPSPAGTAEVTPSSTADISAMADIQVEQGLFDVEFTVPSDFTEEGTTQADYDARAKESGWKSATLNADNSVTYVMTKAQHNEMMQEMKETIDAELAALVESAEYPNFVSILPNDDYTEYTIVTKSDSVNMMESMSLLLLYFSGGMYNTFNGTPVDNIHVEFVNEVTGAVIQEADSSSMG